jgi:hypothetical protein
MDDKHPHSQEPWRWEAWPIPNTGEDGFALLASGGYGVLWVDLSNSPQETNPHNARRIVACVNACEGISTEALEDWAPRIHQREEIRETILGALQVALVHATDFADTFSMSVTHMTDEEMKKPLGEHTRSPNAILRGRRESVRKIEDAIKVVSEWPMR